MIKTDVFGNQLVPGDFILCSNNTKDSRLYPHQVIGLTPSGNLRLNPKRSWGRNRIESPETQAVKITKEQYESFTYNY